MNIIDIKAKIEIPELLLSVGTQENGDESNWLSHWDDDKRIRVIIPKDVAKNVKEDSQTSLHLITQDKVSKEAKKPYVLHTIVGPSMIL